MLPSDDYLESVEALSWLQQADNKRRNVGDSSECLTPEDTLRLVQELYEAGAPEVLAQDVEVDEEVESGNSLKVTLPQAPQSRAVLFAIEERVLRDTNSAFDPEGEQGQAFFTLGW